MNWLNNAVGSKDKPNADSGSAEPNADSGSAEANAASGSADESRAASGSVGNANAESTELKPRPLVPARSVAGKVRLAKSRPAKGSSALGRALVMELMMGSRITSNGSAWAAGAVDSGPRPNAKNALALPPRPTARRWRRALALLDRSFRLLLLRL